MKISNPVQHSNGTVSVAFLRKEDREILNFLAAWQQAFNNPNRWDHRWATDEYTLLLVDTYEEERLGWLLFEEDGEEAFKAFRRKTVPKNPRRGAGRKPRTHRDA